MSFHVVHSMSCDWPWLVHVQWHGLRYHVQSYFTLPHVTWYAGMMVWHFLNWTWKVMCVIQEVILQISCWISIQYKMKKLNNNYSILNYFNNFINYSRPFHNAIDPMFRLYSHFRPPYHVPSDSWMDMAIISVKPP